MITFTKVKIPLILILITVLAEVFLWNASSVVSLFYKETQLDVQIDPESTVVRQDGMVDLYTASAESPEELRKEYETFLLPDGKLTLIVSAVDAYIHNLHLKIVPVSELSAGGQNSLSYVISLSDEGNYYAYDLPAGIIVEGVKETEYTNIYPFGKVRDMQITFSASDHIVVEDISIRADVKKPFNFSVMRFTALFLLLMVAWRLLSGKIWNRQCEDGNRLQYLITAAVMLFVIICSYRFAILNPVNVRPVWPHHNQYHELAELLLQGETALTEKPPEELIRAQNPYDTIWLQAQDIDYKADYVYYNGNYYIYFGIVPELLLYLPFYLIMGFHLPNYFAVFIFFAGFAVMVFALYRELIRRRFSGTPFLVYLLVSAMTIFTGSFIWTIADPDLYDVPITAALLFTVLGLWFWLKAGHAAGRKQTVFLTAGSLSMALVAGCRPQMVLYSALAIPLFCDNVRTKLFSKEHSLKKDSQASKADSVFSKISIKNIVAFCLPYLVVAAGVMYYNRIRFDSFFDFGAAYSLTSNDMTRRTANLENTLLGIYHYFLQPPTIRAGFPYLFRNPIETAYMGKLTSEYTFGGLLICNAFLWFTGLIGIVKKQLEQKKLFFFVLTAMSVSLVIAVTDTNFAGILQRYMTDFTWGIVLAAGICAFAWTEQKKDNKNMLWATVFLSFFILQVMYSFLLVFGGGSDTYGLASMAPEIFYRFASWF